MLEDQDITPRYEPSSSELAALINDDIPAITIGLTKSGEKEQETEHIEIEPIFKGLAQLVALVMAIDGGYTDEY